MGDITIMARPRTCAPSLTGHHSHCIIDVDVVVDVGPKIKIRPCWHYALALLVYVQRKLTWLAAKP